MKKLSLLAMVLAITVSTTVFSQKDTIFTTLTQETGTLEQRHFMSEYDQAFGMMTPARWMFKSDLLSTLSDLFVEPGFNGGVEAKIDNSISVGVNCQYSRESPLTNLDFEFNNSNARPSTTRLSTTARWYFNMNKRIQNGKSASNFSGNYFAFESAVIFDKPIDKVLKNYDLTVKYGIQRRLLKMGYFDLSYGLGGRYYPGDRNTGVEGWWALNMRPQTSIGLALFTPRKSNIPEGAVCEMFKCFQESRQMLKIDLYNLFQVGIISKRNTDLSANPSIAYERKIGTSPFSTEIDVSGNAGYYSGPTYYYPDQQTIYGKQIGGAGSTELRWYYSQKKRIIQGKSGNNLSGVFVALNVAYSINNIHSFLGQDYHSTESRSTVRALYGIQHRILDNGFVQFKIGLGPAWAKTVTTRERFPVQTSAPGLQLDIFSELKAGFAF